MAISEVGNASADAASGTAVSVTHGLTIAANDVIVATVHANGASTAVSDNNGAAAFTFDDYGSSADSARLYVFHRIAGASEPSAYAFTLSTSARWSIVVRVFRGVDTSSVWDVAPSGTQCQIEPYEGGVTACVSTDMTVATAGAAGLILISDDYAPTTNSFSDPTNGYGNEKEEAGQQVQATYTRLGLSTGAVGTVTVTAASTAYPVIYHVALKPAASARPVFAESYGGLNCDMTGGM